MKLIFHTHNYYINGNREDWYFANIRMISSTEDVWDDYI